MLPCDDTVCLECVETKILQAQPHEQNSRSLRCCLNYSHTFEDLNCDKVNKYILKKLSDQDFVTIVCDQHPDMFALYYCNQCDQFICELCITQQHKSHKGGQKSHFTKPFYEQYLRQTLPDFEATIKNLQTHIDNVLSLKQNDAVKDKDFRRSFRLIKQFLIIFSDRIDPISDFEKIQHILDQYSFKRTKCSCSICLNFSWSNGFNSVQISQPQIIQQSRQSQSNDLAQNSSELSLSISNHVQQRQSESSDLLETNISGQLSQINQQISQNQGGQDDSQQSQNQNLPQPVPQQNLNSPQLPQQDAIAQDSQSQNVQQSEVIEEEKSTEVILPPRTVPAISDQQGYKEFVRLVDIEVQKKQNSILANSILNHQNATFRLLYQGTRDGFTVQDLKRRMESQRFNSNVTFILSNQGQVFGGFSRTKRSFPELETNIFDDQAFIFQLNKQKVLSVNVGNANKYLSVTHKSDYLCGFGQHGIKIPSNCNINQCESYVGIGFVLPYELRNETRFNPGSDESGEQQWEIENTDLTNEIDERRRKYLAGARRFTVDEIEVYEIQYPEDINI
eukprot:403361590